MKFSSAIALLFLSAAFVFGADAGPRSAKARAARLAYQGDVKRAKAEYAAKAGLAVGKYLDALQQALAGATQANDANDAAAIRAEMQAVKMDLPGTADAAAGLIVDKAVYSLADQAVDATDRVRAKVNHDVLIDPHHLQPALVDFAPYRNKVLTIHGTYAGKPFYLSIHDKPWDDGGVWFGDVPPPYVAQHFAAVKKP